MQLEKYRKNNKLSYKELGSLIGVSKTQAWKLCMGKVKDPRLSWILKIEKVTDGAVTPEDFKSKL